jgi:large subunit ribosomal protein L17
LRHGDKVKKLGRTKQHREAMFRNMVSSLIEHERIRTTLPKAKVARSYAERLISFARSGTVADRREVGRFIADKSLVKKLFDVIAPRFKDRQGGCTRIYRLGPREGDGSEMALLDLTVREEKHREKKAKEAVAKEKGGRRQKAAKAEKQSERGKDDTAK